MVAGEVSASNTVMKNIRGFPSEKVLASKVLPLPEVTQGKTLTSGEIGPVMEKGKIIKASIEHGKFTFFNRKDVFSLTDAEGEPFAGGAHFLENFDLVHRNRIVFRDKDEKPIALAVQEKLRVNKAYFIYSREPLFEKDAAEETESGINFFPMFKMRDIDDSHLDFRSLLIWNGNNYQPYLRIFPAQRLPDVPGGNLVPPAKGDNLVMDPNDREKIYAIMSKKKTSRIAGWDIQIAPGADAGCMLMLTAILDDMVGWFA